MTTPTELSTELVDLDTLAPHPENANLGNDDAVADSLNRYGQWRPLVAQRSTGRVLIGHTMLRAARSLGWQRIAVHYRDVDDDEARRILAVDNRTRDLADTDERALIALLESLDDDLTGTGYQPDDLAHLRDLIAAEDQAFLDATRLRGPDPDAGTVPDLPGDVDDAPPLPKEPTTRPGDVWQLGDHRLICGDATDPDVWATLLGDELADLMWTDPPYGIEYQMNLSPEEAKRLRRRSDGLQVENDNLDPKALDALLTTTFTHARDRTTPGACWYVCSPPGPLMGLFGAVLTDLGVWRQTLTWLKDRFVLGRSDYHYRHEPIFYGWTPGAAHHPVPNRTQDSVFEIPRPRTSTEHPTMKPVQLIAQHIINSTDPEAIVVDPFAGSGSTLIAAHRTYRTARLIELDPAYCDVIVNRWTQHIGQDATRIPAEGAA